MASDELDRNRRSHAASVSLSRAGRFILRNGLIFCSLVLLGASAFFYIGAERIRKDLRKSELESFESGDKVTIVEIIDGDEVSVRKVSGEKANVRLLGIKSFKPSRRDPLVAQHGKNCFDYLKAHFHNKEARVVIGEKKSDRYGRLLAYLEVRSAEGGAFDLDLGEELVRKGLSLAFVRYDFDRQDNYVAAEQQAMMAKLGLWSNEAVKSRALGLKDYWLEAKKQSD